MSEPKTKLKLIFKVPLMVSKKVIFPYLNSHCVNELFGLLFLKLQALQPSSFKHFSTVFSILLNWHSSLSKPFGFNAFPLLGNPFIQVICGAAKVNTQWRSAKLFSSFFKTFFSRFSFSILYSLALLFKADANVLHLLPNFLIIEELFLRFFFKRSSACHYSSALFSFRLAF